MSAATTFLAALALTTQAAHLGDVHFGDEKNGHFVAFSTHRVDWVNPQTQEIEYSITADDYAAMPATWSDVVYIRSLDHIRHYIMANVKDENRMLVIDADTKTIAASLDVGVRPVHLYAIERRQEVWTHADNDGHFAVVHLSDVEALHYLKAEKFVEQAGHGKLLFEQALGDVAWATNVAEPGIYKMNLENKASLLNFKNFTDDGCPGTHGITMASNLHLFIECTGGSGTLEYDLKTEQVVTLFPSAKGQTYSSPEEEYIAAINKGESKVHVWKVGENGQTTNQPKNIDVNGNPDKIAWYPLVDGSEKVSDHLLFMAQTQANGNPEGEDAFQAGIAMLDMEEVLAWDGVSVATKPIVTEFPLGDVRRGGWSTYRPIKHGGDFIATPVNTNIQGSQPYGVNGLGLVNAKTRSSLGVVEIPAYDGAEDVVTAQVLWAPEHTDELRYEISQSLNAKVVEAAAMQSVAVNQQVTDDVSTLQQQSTILMAACGVLFVMNVIQIGCACKGGKQTRGHEAVPMKGIHGDTGI